MTKPNVLIFAPREEPREVHRQLEEAISAFLGTVERLKSRMPSLKIAVVSPVESGDEAKPKITPADLKSGTILLVIRPLPAPYATNEEMRAAIKRQMAQRRDNKCEL